MDYSLLDPTLKKYSGARGSLIAILQEAQDIFGHIPLGLIEHIANKTGERPAKVQGVATFYTQFRSEPAGRHRIMLCQGTACHVNGSDAIYNALSATLDVADGGTTADGGFTLTNVACLGCCSLSPAMTVDGVTYGSLTPEKAVAALKNIDAGPTS